MDLLHTNQACFLSFTISPSCQTHWETCKFHEHMQAVMGTLVKRFLAKQLGLRPDQIYHCAVMPCYDKKLEGSREDFMIPGKTVNYFDVVLRLILNMAQLFNSSVQ